MHLYHTFISYSRDDGEFALKLANDLRVAGVNVWLDQLDIPPGARWDRAVESALETCGRLLVILSPTSADSENVQDEIGVAFDNKKPIVPILAAPCEVPMRLRRLQYIDFSADYDRGLQTLLTVLKLPVQAPDAGAVEGGVAVATPVVTATGAVRRASAGTVAPRAAGGWTRKRVAYTAAAVVALFGVVGWLAGGAPEDAAEPAASADAAGVNAGADGSTVISMTSLRIVNGSDWRIDEMYLRQSGQVDWGRELLGANITISAKGGEHTLRQILPCGKYDLRLVDEVGDACEAPEQNFCGEDLVWEFSSDDLLECQGLKNP